MSYDAQTSTSLINKLRKDVDALVLRIATLQDQKATGVDVLPELVDQAGAGL